MNGGAGTDTVSITANGSATITNTQITGQGTDKISSIERVNVFGSNNSQTLNAFSFSGRSLIYGYGGNDFLYGGRSNDSLYGGSGNDYLSGSGGSDYLRGDSGNDTLYGGTGFDSARIGSNGDIVATNTQITGEGTDTINSIERLYLYGTNTNQTIDAEDFTGRTYQVGMAEKTRCWVGSTTMWGQQRFSVRWRPSRLTARGRRQ